MAVWFEADAPLAFNTHFHVKGDVRAPENMSSVSAAQGRLTPKGDRKRSDSAAVATLVLSNTGSR